VASRCKNSLAFHNLCHHLQGATDDLMLGVKWTLQKHATFSLNYVSAKHKRASNYLICMLRTREPKNRGLIRARDKTFSFWSARTTVEARPVAGASSWTRTPSNAQVDEVVATYTYVACIDKLATDIGKTGNRSRGMVPYRDRPNWTCVAEVRQNTAAVLWRPRSVSILTTNPLVLITYGRGVGINRGGSLIGLRAVQIKEVCKHVN
jgi:hypothetical protein